MGTLAPLEDTLATRLGIFAFCLAFGAWMVVVGRQNVGTRTAEETGARAAWLRLWGKSAALEGRRAVAMGVLRIAVGIAAIVFGAVYLVLGPFLAK